MKTLIVLLITCQLGIAHADWDDPTEPFNTNRNDHTTMSITWLPVDNVQKTCQAEYAKRGHKVFGYQVDACSFWNGSTCTIITKRKPNMHNVGHEVRHCFQGNWHQ